MSSESPPYSKLAIIYDQMGQDRHSKDMVLYTRELFDRLGFQPRDGLDLCCGTGTALALLDDMGYRMSGLDGSAAMLTVAARKLKGRGIQLYHKQLPRFRLLDDDDSSRWRRFDFVTSFYDSLNYLMAASDLEAAFRSVRSHLRPGGLFVFDMNTPRALQVIWDEQVYADSCDDIAWVWKNEYDPKRRVAACYATCFYRKGSTWRRFDEVHWERGYENEQIKRLLKRAGLRIRGFYKCGTLRRPGPKTYRIAVVAQRPK